MRNILNKRFGSFSVTQFQPLCFDDLGSANGGLVKLVHQETFETIIIHNDLALRNRKWYTNYFKEIKVEDKNLNKLIEKVLNIFHNKVQ